MSILLLVHLLAVFVWAGCVLTESVMELTSRNDPAKRAMAAQLHYRIDVLIEVPLLITILCTGVMLLFSAQLSIMLMIKIALALFAIAANFFCVVVVFKRRRAALENDALEVEKLTYWVLFTGLASPAFIGAFAIGLARLYS